MTNHTPDDFPALAASGYSTRELEEQAEALNNAPAGSYYANALAFVIESFLEGNAEDYTDFSTMDHESLLEFAEMYNTTTEMIAKAVRDIRTVAENTMVD